MKSITKRLMFIIQAAISAGLLYLAASGGFLPGKYMTLLAVLIVVLLVITFLLTQSRKSPVRIIGIVLAIIISGVLLTGAVYIHRILNTLDQISEEKAQVSGYVVSVASDNSALTIEETSGYRIGILSDMDTDLTEKICTEIGTANGDTEGSSSPLHTESFESPVAMAQALLDGEIDAGVLNEAYTDILDEVVEDYSSKTRVIYEMEFQTNTYGNAETSDTSTTAGEKTSENEASGKIMDNSLIEDAFTVLISGIDVRGSISKTSRSDVNILMTVNPKTHRILLTTTPRDYYVYIPEVSGGMRDKLTHAGIYGVEASMRTLGNLYDVEVNDYIRINFDSVVQLVDALGGVDVYSDYTFTTRGGKYTFSEGLNHLNGEEALAFSRERYAFQDGDNQRGRNQMAVLAAMINKLQSPAILKNPGEILKVVGESMQTSFTRTEIADLIAWQLSEGKGWDVTRQAVSGHGDSQQTYSMKGINLYVMWPDEESVAEAAKKIREITEEN